MTNINKIDTSNSSQVIFADHINGIYSKDISETHLSKQLNIIPFVSLREVVGREKELKEVKEKLDTDKNLVLVNGIGGIGKTTFAKAFIQQYMECYNHVVWISASPSVKETITMDVTLIHNLKLKDEIKNLIEAKQPDDAFKLILNKLCDINGENLFLLDNAEIKDTPEIELLQALVNSGWKILITSRQQISGCKEYFLDVLSPEEARELFHTHYKQKTDDKELDALLNYISYHTLTVELLAKTADLNPMLGIKQIRKYLEEKNLDNKKLDVKIKSPYTGEKEINIYTHLMSIFELTKLNDDEKKILVLFSVLPSRDIEVKLLRYLFGISKENVSGFINMLTSLTVKGYLIRNNTSYKIHPFLQEITKYTLNYSIDDFKVLIKSMNNLLYIDDVKGNPVSKFPYVDLGITIIKNLDSDKNLIKARKNFIKLFNNLIINVGLRFQDLGKYNKAKELFKMALDSAEKNFEEKHHNTINQTNLFHTYQYLGRYKDAAELLEKALKNERMKPNMNKLDVTLIKSNLALMYTYLDKANEAITILTEILEEGKNNFDENSIIISECKSNLAKAYKSVGRYEEAIIFFRQALESNRRKLGETHLKVLNDQLELISLYLNRDNNEPAKILLEKYKDVYLDTLGPDHPNSKMVIENLNYLQEEMKVTQ